MAGVKSVTIDGEGIFLFNSALYVFESSKGCSLELDMIVSEVVLRKYKDNESHIIEIELEDNRVISSFMFLKIVPGRLPHLNLFCDLEDPDEYPGLLKVHENDLEFPDVEQGITLEEIRKVEMPNEKVTLKLTLPIDQVEWLKGKKTKELNAIFKEWLGEHLKK
ncbi:hypothetical protein [Bacillus sp. FJAT-27251]|uniref:hypothetical protein n=1 Tax=Bacillus sp. FJAT-27251 TaxID=1684142 RepID=UPI0006A77E7F|nr:hypothetical protein [Bacillus sp. FJAT-27251]